MGYLRLIWFNLEVLHQGTTGKMKETIENMREKRDHLLVTHSKKRTETIGRMRGTTEKMKGTTGKMRGIIVKMRRIIERKGLPVKMRGTTVKMKGTIERIGKTERAGKTERT